MAIGGTLEARDLRLVQAIAEFGGATHAARHLHLSQSAVSHQLKNLEDRLGVPLFERQGKRLHITSAGRKLVVLAGQVLLPLLQAELELKRSVQKERPQLRVATQCYTAYHWLPKALQSLLTEHPEVELVLQSDVVGDAEAQLSGGHCDLVLCVAAPRRGPFTKVPLFDDELVLAVPRGHALARKKYVVGADLEAETLIQIAVSAPERERVIKKLFKGQPRVRRVLRLPVTEAVVDLVQAGVGVSILARFTLRQHLARGDVEAVRLTQHGLGRSWTGVFQRNSALDAPIRTLLSTLKRYGTG
jgi:LysR family transcriptional regulator, regulator for metE and metH